MNSEIEKSHLTCKDVSDRAEFQHGNILSRRYLLLLFDITINIELCIQLDINSEKDDEFHFHIGKSKICLTKGIVQDT